MIERLELLLTRVWREDDLEGALAELPPDFEWLVPGFPGSQVARGPEATLDFFRDWIDQWEDLRVDWELEQSSPDTVFAVVDMRGRGRASGVPVEERIAHLWTFRDGLAVELRAFTDPADALEAAGLPRTLTGE
jgi:uncharacterized protein